MAENITPEMDHAKPQRQAVLSDGKGPGRESDLTASDGQEFYSPSLLGEPALTGRSNTLVRVGAISRAQQTYGNRAVQRSIRSTGSGRRLMSVQRGWFDDATGWVGDKASGAANWASKEASDVAAHPLDSLAAAGAYVPIPGNPLQMAKAGHDINQLFGAGHNEQGDATPSLFEKGVNWMRDGSEKGANDLVAQTADIPVLGTLARANASVSKFTGDVTSGALKAVGGMVGGIGGMLEHPLDTAMGLEKVGENVGLPSYLNPLRMAHGVYDVASGNRGVGDAAEHWLDPIEQQKQSQEFFGNMFMGQEGKDGKRHGGMVEGYRNDWNEGRYGSMIGRAGVDIGSFFIGGGEANAASKVGEAGTALRAVGEAGTLARGAGELGTAVRGAGEVSTGLRGAGEVSTGVRAAGDVGDMASGVRSAGEVSGEGGNVLRSGGGGAGGAISDGAHAPGPAPTAYEPHPFEFDPSSSSGLKPVDPAPAQFPIPEKPMSGPSSGLELVGDDAQIDRGLADRGYKPQPGERNMSREEWLKQNQMDRAEASSANRAAPEITEVNTTDQKLNDMRQLVENGDLKRISSDPELFNAYEDYMGNRTGNATGRQGFNNLRGGLNRRVNLGGDVHHFDYPIGDFEAEAMDAKNLYTTSGDPAHVAAHRAMGVPGSMYERMAWGSGLNGVKDMLDFGKNIPLEDVFGLLGDH